MPTWTNEVLEKYRSMTDPIADHTVAQIIGGGQTLQANTFLKQLIENDDFPTDAPKVLQDYIAQTQTLPAWANPDLIKQGEKLFSVYGGELSMLLLCKSLPASYACWRGAKVLYSTGRLAEHRGSTQKFTRRLMETSQFVINVMAEGGMSTTGKGIRTAQKVRLMHASIRYFLKQYGWDAATLGEPINQEDLAGTLMAFAVYPLEGMEQLGIQISTAEQDAYIHTWNVVGHIMGVNPDFFPKNYKEGLDLGYRILDHQKGESQEGKELLKACVDFLEQVTPGNKFDFYPEVLIRYLLRDELADMLGLPKMPLGELFNRLALRIIADVEHLKEHSQIVQRLSKRFTRSLLQGMINYYNNEKQIQFTIPPSLQANWLQEDLKDDWANILSSPALAGWRVALQRKMKN